MSQRNVERILGRLVTDEAFRRRFAADPRAALAEMTSCCGGELNECERRALEAVDPEAVRTFAEALDPRIQKCDLEGERT
jgi:putative modified peptide